MTMLDDRPMARDEEPLAGEQPPSEPPDEVTEESPFGRWWSVLPTIALVLVACLVGAAAVVLWNQNEDLRSERDDRREAAEVASGFTTAVLSYNFRDLQGSVDDVLALSTTDWGRQYEDAWFQEQQPIVEATRARARVAVSDVMLGDESNGVLPAVVRFDATINSEVGTRRLQGGYLQVDLTDVDGEWKVDDMRYLATQAQDLQPNEGAGAPTAPEGG
jgi:hypothetical protein